MGNEQVRDVFIVFPSPTTIAPGGQGAQLTVLSLTSCLLGSYIISGQTGCGVNHMGHRLASWVLDG